MHFSFRRLPQLLYFIRDNEHSNNLDLQIIMHVQIIKFVVSTRPVQCVWFGTLSTSFSELFVARISYTYIYMYVRVYFPHVCIGVYRSSTRFVPYINVLLHGINVQCVHGMHLSVLLVLVYMCVLYVYIYVHVFFRVCLVLVAFLVNFLALFAPLFAMPAYFDGTMCLIISAFVCFSLSCSPRFL